tara:strand:- start:116 stop:676 length:561 start_codon:yes stop_codon:yes gene_type:complete
MSKINVNTVEPEGATTTLTLGASGDTISIPSGATIANSGTATGFGKVLQVQSTLTLNPGSDLTTTSSSYVAMGSDYEVAITPAATSSKVLIQFYVPSHFTDGSAYQTAFTIYRDIGGAGYSEITTGAKGVHQSQSSNYQMISVAYLDSPNTTSACTYKLYWKVANGTTAKAAANAAHVSLAWEVGA